MSLSLVQNENIYIVFDAQAGAFECKSREIKYQIIFIVAALEKYKQITFLKDGKLPKNPKKISKHYLIHDDSVTVQRSFLKFFEERLLKLQESPLSYSKIINCLD